MKRVLMIIIGLCLISLFVSCSSEPSGKITVNKRQEKIAKNLYNKALSKESIEKNGFDTLLSLFSISYFKYDEKNIFEFKYTTNNELEYNGKIGGNNGAKIYSGNYVTSNYYYLKGKSIKRVNDKLKKKVMFSHSNKASVYWDDELSQKEQIEELYEITQYL